MQAFINDNNVMYVTDLSPSDEIRYRVRFHFDPNAIGMGNGDSYYLLQAYRRDVYVAASVVLRYSLGDYQVSAEAGTDAGATNGLPSWKTISDGPHSIEIEWKAATAAGANNGVLTLWVDGTQTGSIAYIDNDTLRVDFVNFGAVYGIDTTTRGTTYSDAFESRRQTYIGPDPNAATPPPPPAKPDALFSDGFETGTLAAWSYNVNDGGDLAASTSAAILGTYGMRALLDDNVAIYVRDYSPWDETHYRARFYFDPNSVPMANGDWHSIFRGFGHADTYFRLLFRFAAGDYQVRAEVSTDLWSWFNTAWFTLTDGPHALEIDWKAATAAGANNGLLTLWVDGTQQATFTTIDNDTHLIQAVDLGPYAGVSTGTRGTTYTDGFVSHRATSIGLDPAAPTPPPLPTPTETIFSDGFESGNLSAWSYNTNDGGDLSATTGSALAGTYGMAALLDDNASIYVEDWKPYDDTQHRQRFYFDPNTITMANNDAHYIFQALNRDATVVERIEFRRYSSTYQVRAEAVNDGSTWSSTSWVTISDAPHYLEANWKAATASGANNGILTFWVDGVQQGSFTTIDNDTRKVDQVRLGAVSGVDTGSRGTEFFDAYESRRTTYIGPIAGLAPRYQVVDLPSWETVRTYLVSFFRPPEMPVVDVAEPSPKVVLAVPDRTPAPPVPATPQPLLPVAGVGASHVLAAPVAVPPAEDVQPIPFHPAIAYRAITYTYDPLYRLTNASYNDGSYFTYTYDATGNRLTEVTNAGSVSYVYDNANRLTSVGGVTHTWDNNGILLSDGTSTYTYDKANRLKSVVQGGTTYGFVYNGLGDRLRQTINSTPTTYAVDMAGGLTQVLGDGTNFYLYGTSRIGEKQTGGWRYHVPDALGSVRQLIDSSGAVTLAKAYAPFGNSYYSFGTGSTAFQFVGEQRDATGLVFLRARYMSTSQGRFLSADVWEGDPLQPMSGNLWLYAYDNPVNFTDPTGRFPTECQEMPSAREFEQCALDYYHVTPIDQGSLGDDIRGTRGCYYGKVNYRAPGYIEGIGGFLADVWGGFERVYSLARMERSDFVYVGAGISDSMAGVGLADYAGAVLGLPSDKPLPETYRGLSYTGQYGISIPLGLFFKGVPGAVGDGISVFNAINDPQIWGATFYVGGSLSHEVLMGPFSVLDVGGAVVQYFGLTGSRRYYATAGRVNRATMLTDILTSSPIWVEPFYPFTFVGRGAAATASLYYAWVYEELATLPQ
jgi:RHS repeat-associated protein